MKRTIYAIALVALFLALPAAAQAQAAAPCQVRESDLLGAWASAGKAGYFQQMEFSVTDGKNAFNSWLHDRPEVMNAQWTLAQCELRITKATDASLSFTFNVALRNRRLELRESGSPVARYRKIGKGN